MSVASRNPERDAAIADAYRAGELMREIAARFGLSLGRISMILDAQDARPSRDEIGRRVAESNRLISANPEVRAKIAETVRKAWERGDLRGRPRLFSDDPARRADYCNLRRAYGADYARRAMGLSTVRDKWVEVASVHVARAPDVYSYSASVSQEAA